jgi:hypothetical protein
MKKAIWITWEKQIRNRSMAAMLGVDLYVISHDHGRLRRYLYCAFDTISTIRKAKPDVVFAQNPSIVLNYLLLFWRYLFNFKLVIDAHFGGVTAYNGSYLFQKALDLCNRCAAFVIVTNKFHAEYVYAVGGNPIICEDPLPDLSIYDSGQEPSGKSVFFICSFDIDEPYIAAFDAAKLLTMEGFSFYVSGKYSKVGIIPANYPFVNFLGFVPEFQFYERLYKSDVVLDLTEHDNCLLCGAYEAMAAERPLVTSERVCLKEYFNKGTIFTQHDGKSIADAVKAAYQERVRLKVEIREWKLHVMKLQNERKSDLFAKLGMV